MNIYDIKVSDIVKFNIKNFKFPVEITSDMLKIFIKKNQSSLFHMFCECTGGGALNESDLFLK